MRLGFAPGERTQLRNPVSGKLAGDATGALASASGPWGSVSQLMVDQCVVRTPPSPSPAGGSSAPRRRPAQNAQMTRRHSAPSCDTPVH